MDSSRTNYSNASSDHSRRSSASSVSGITTRSNNSKSSNIDNHLHYQSGYGSKRFSKGNNRKSSIIPNLKVSPFSRMSDFFSTVGGGKDPDGFVPRKKDEECMKCMLRIPHSKCVSHKYIRVGGGYRHSYFYVRMILEQIELKRQREEMLRRRLEAISEGNTRAIKMFIRTKSGRLVEKIIYLTDEDYKAFQDALKRGEDPSKIFSNYLSKNEMDNLKSYDKDEQQAIKTYIRTKSGRLIEKIIYISKKEYDAIQRGELDPNDILRKRLGLKSGENLEGWQKSTMKTITTKIRTKSGRIIEKQIQISEEDYQKLMAGGNLDDILKKYVKPGDGSIVGWEKSEKPGMKVVKTFVRTKSGRLVEKVIMMTEEEYKDFLKNQGDPNFLKKYLDLKEGETIEKWEKGSTVYEGSDDEHMKKAKPGTRIKDKDGNEYEIAVDPITGKKYKKLIKKAGEKNLLTYKTKNGKIITEKDIKKRNDFKQGKRNVDSASDYSYRSIVSAGGTRHVRRRRRNADGTYGNSDSYHSSQDEEGTKRRRQRRRQRKHGANSAHSYYSVVSAGGTKHVRRRIRNADGTYGDSESYHSEDSADFKNAEKSILEQKKKLTERGRPDSAASYYSDISVGGTRRKMKRMRIRDEHGNIIGYGKSEEVDINGKPIKKKGMRGRNHSPDSEFSYFSEVSAGGTHYQKKKKRIRDKNGRVIGYGKTEDYSSDEEKNKKQKRRRGGPNSAYSYYSEYSEGGTKTVKRKKRIRDENGNIIGHAKSESYSSSGESDGKGGKIKKKNTRKPNRKYSNVFSDATTDSDIVRERLKNMTEEEKAVYLEQRKKRAEEREEKRREKYGDKYEQMAEIYKKKKEIYKEKLKIEANSSRRDTTAGSTVKGGKKKGVDGNDADTEGEKDDNIYSKKKGHRKGSGDSSIEVIRDKDGNIIKKIKRDKDGNLYEEEYDKSGNVIKTKLKGNEKKNKDQSDDDSDYFEIGPDGKIRVKPGKKKIDLKNISKEDLLRLGIDPNLSKAEQLRLLKEMFGDDIVITYGNKKIGVKNADDYNSSAGTSDLAGDSDLDIDTAKPEQRVKIILKRGGQKLQDYMKQVIDQSMLNNVKYGDENDSKIDFLSAYRLVDPNNLDKYARFFAIEDHDNMDGIITYKGCLTALNNLKRTHMINNLTDKQTDYILKALDIDRNSEISFRMFAVISSLGDRMTKLDAYSRDLLEISNMLDITRKLKFYRDLFNMNALSDRDPNYIKMESISIDLRAGGLNSTQQTFVISKLKPNELLEISFIDYLSYIPLFISYHDNIMNNPLDMSDNKYSNSIKRRASVQRDMNPLGYPLTRNSEFYKKHYSQNKTSIQINPITDDNLGVGIVGKAKKMSKYTILPDINSSRK